VTEYRRILLDGAPVQVVRDGENLIAGDGRVVAIADATHLAPVEPTKIICVHLNYDSRTQEFMTKLPPAPTYFHKPITALNSHNGAVVRPNGCKWLNYEGEIVIVIGPPDETAETDAHADLDKKIEAALQKHSAKDAAAIVAGETGLPRRKVYARVLELAGARAAEPDEI
jgi:2-keto-4-pentenoate hydratase/2-oxohepta-3-ene-1,7-dioic acid hydratase in catechol pathway